MTIKTETKILTTNEVNKFTIKTETKIRPRMEVNKSNKKLKLNTDHE